MKGVIDDDLVNTSSALPLQLVSSSSLLEPKSTTTSSSSSLSSSKVYICPLDILARGIIGIEISSLIHTLRIHKTSLVTISDHLYQLSEKINNEVKKEIDFLCKTSENILFASDISNDLLLINNCNHNNNNSNGKDDSIRSNRSRRTSINKGDITSL